MFLFIMEYGSFATNSSLFKYISCSYLSVCCFGRAFSFWFKYISCSYLSSTQGFDEGIKKNSNTSHVLIYLGIPSRNYKGYHIQIHLMFLFIFLHNFDFSSHFVFKYISCSYLSQSLLYTSFSIAIQIHLMFLFIQCRWLFRICI